MMITFQEVSIKATKKYIDVDGKKRQKTKKFYQTISPFNKNPDGTVKTKADIMEQILKEKEEWLNTNENTKRNN